MSTPNYKTSRKYKCPYCDHRAARTDLVDHVAKKHDEMIPEEYTAARAVYDSVNGKDHGTCMICKKPVYKWNEKINRYYNLCDDPKCRAAVRATALERHLKVYNKPTLLNDAEHQEKMLANRKISGSYTFSDGGKVTYTGQYEKKALEFMDLVLGIPSRDIQAPGPVLEYEYGGKKHKWITDIYYIPGNLLIEVKDGGTNPNTRSMKEYREKQIAKETMVTNIGTFNYIRLTDNNFAQLLDIFADMKNGALFEENPKMRYHINEEVGGLPRHGPPVAYIVPYGMNNVFDGLAYGDSQTSHMITTDDEGNIIPIDDNVFNETYDVGPMLVYNGKDTEEKIKTIHEFIKSGDKVNGFLHFAEMLVDRPLRKFEEIFLTECFKYYDKHREEQTCQFIENGILREADEIALGITPGTDSNVVKTIGSVFICHSPKGYYACTRRDFYMASEYFQDMESLRQSGVIDIMNDIYTTSYNRVHGGESK